MAAILAILLEVMVELVTALLAVLLAVLLTLFPAVIFREHLMALILKVFLKLDGLAPLIEDPP